MTETPQNTPNFGSIPSPSQAELEALVGLLRRKEGTWVEWGDACQTLQKAGYKPQEIFEQTGFEPIQQNQVIVGAQVYASMVKAGVSDAARSHFQQRGSDILYEFRILTQPERAAAADLVVDKKLDVDEAREVAKAMKDFSRLPQLPEGFSAHPGDTVAYQCWKFARQQQELQERSRLIAKGLKFVQSSGAREQLEKLLTDFTVVRSRPAPRVPVYRLETDEDLPRLLPVVGQMPLSVEDLQAVPPIEEIGPFQMVKYNGNQAWVPVPSWQVLRNAEDPVAILCKSNELPTPLPGKVEDLLVIVERSQPQWDENSYFLIEESSQLQIQWFDSLPEIPLLGKLILVMRPKKIFDEEYTKEPWQIDE